MFVCGELLEAEELLAGRLNRDMIKLEDHIIEPSVNQWAFLPKHFF